MFTTVASVPGLLAAQIPARTLAIQWQAIYDRGKVAAPGVAILSLLSYAYLAYSHYHEGREWKGFITAALLTIGIAPFTLIVMARTNNTLIGVANGAVVSVGDEAARQLVQKWGGLNLMRSLLPLAGSVVGLWSVLP